MKQKKEMEFKFNEQGLIPTIVQDIRSKEVLMLAYSNAESIQRTQESRKAWFWSRSRKCLWLKGETSGNMQEIQEIAYDCDKDALLFKVKQNGSGACHTDQYTCFYKRLNGNGNVGKMGKLNKKV